MGAASLWVADDLADDSLLVGATLDNLNKISNVLLVARRAESSQRGYLVTDGAEYLTEFNAEVGRIWPLVEDLRGSFSGNPRMEDLRKQLDEALDKKISELRRTVELYAANRREEARALVNTNVGREYMEAARAIAEQMSDVQRRTLVERRAATEQSQTLLLIFTITGLVLIVIVGALSIAIVRRSAKEREDAYQAVEATNANLEQTVALRTNDLVEANDEIQRFAYIVSHDLRSPLVNIMGFTSELEALRKDTFERLEARMPDDPAERQKDAQLAGDVDESLGFIKTSTTKMDRLINAILRLSREGRRQFQPEWINMDEMLKAIAGAQAHQTQEANAKVIVEPLPGLISDRLAVEQVFSNLVDNALKYLRRDVPGQIVVKGEPRGRNLVFEVLDNGRGIDPADHSRIFDLFRRAGQQDRPGEGIGLAHVRALVRRLGGSISVQSELGQGTVFTVTLPRSISGFEEEAA